MLTLLILVSLYLFYRIYQFLHEAYIEFQQEELEKRLKEDDVFPRLSTEEASYGIDFDDYKATLKVEIKKGSLNIEGIKKYVPDGKTHYFAPQTWDQYIGQPRAKKIIQSFVEGSRRGNTIFPHIIIDGNAGYGKSTLIRLLQQELGSELIEHIASELNSLEQLSDILKRINASDNPIILFVDEVHGLPANLVEVLYPILQDGKINNEHIKPFTFACATTEKGAMLKKWKPFIGRMDINITLQDYTIEEMIDIIKQYHQQVFSEMNIPEEDYLCMAKNSRLTPREATHLLKSYIHLGNIDDTLDVFNIVDRERGLTRLDFKVLKYLSRNDKVGLQGLCSYLDTSQNNFLYIMEPYLIKSELILRTPKGRSISDYGRDVLGEQK